MLYARVSVRLLFVLVLPVMEVLPMSTPEAAALKGLTVVQELNGPTPPTCTPMAEDGMVVVLPAVAGFKAAVALLKYAHTAMFVRPGFNTHAVTTVDGLLPVLELLLGASVKFTVVPAVTVTVSDSPRVALNCTLPTLELPGAAAAVLLSRAIAPATASTLAKR